MLLSVSYVHAQDKDNEVAEEETCSLDPSKASDCATADKTATTTDELLTTYTNVQDLTRQVIPLTDETFDELTWTSEPSTWIIMFKTDSCGLCKKAKPILESLAVDADIISHNDEQMKEAEVGDNIEDGSTEVDDDDEQTPKGLIYVGTIDAGSWSGRDITKRFEVDGTPHMILIRNEGYTDVKDESRSYYVYRGQRALYPLRRFVLGEFASRKQLEMPPPLSQEERKKSGFVGRLYDFLLLPSVKWAGTIVGKIILAWVVFISLLGLFMRVHNYAWGENADDDNYNKEKEEAIEKEKAKGRAEFEEDKDEKAKRRQQIMWERKRANHEKRKKKEAAATSSSGKDDCDDDADDDDLQGVGKVVTRSQAMKAKAGTKQKKK